VKSLSPVVHLFFLYNLILYSTPCGSDFKTCVINYSVLWCESVTAGTIIRYILTLYVCFKGMKHRKLKYHHTQVTWAPNMFYKHTVTCSKGVPVVGQSMLISDVSRRIWRSLFTNFSKPIPAHVNIQVQYYTKQNVTRGIHTTYINGKCINI